MLRHFCVVLFLSFFGTAHSQSVNCPIDSNLMHTYCVYDTSWYPECGCNNITYRNDCARQQSGVLLYTDRTCEDITIVYLYPIPAFNDLIYRIYLKALSGNASVYIYDVYGNLHYSKYFLGISDDRENLDVTFLPSGVYVLVAIANGHYASKKFVKLQF